MYYDARNSLEAVGTSSVMIAPARVRNEIVLTNTSTGGETITLSFGSPATANLGVVLKPFSVYYASNTTGFNVYQGEIFAICDGAGGQLSVFER